MNIKKMFNNTKRELEQDDLFKRPTPIKEKTISKKKVQVFNNNPIPDKKYIKKAYDKIPDNINIPLQFMTREQYLIKYMNNQEKKYGKKFTPQQKQSYIDERMQEYKHISGRYTTKNNPYYKPAVVIFNDKDNQKNINGKEFKKVAWHEYGHELVEKLGVKLEPNKEEEFCDYLAHLKVELKDNRRPQTILKEFTNGNTIRIDNMSKNKCNKNHIKKDKYSKNTSQTLFHAGDKPPSETLRQEGRVYGFSNVDYAKGWQQKMGKQNLYKFQADEYDLDDKTYVRDTPQGKILSDNEYIVRRVLQEEPLTDEDSKNMAWKSPDNITYVEEMSPDEYLRRTHPDPENFQPTTYYDTETEKEEPIQQLSQHITSKDVEVPIPFTETQGSDKGLADHEGRHRAYAAKIGGLQTIPVSVPPPQSWRTQEIKDEFVKITFPRDVDSPYGETWKKRLDRPFPTEQMGSSAIKNYEDILKERGLLKQDEYSKNNRKVKCSVCYKLYPSVVEDDYSDRCTECEESDAYRTLDNKVIKRK